MGLFDFATDIFSDVLGTDTFELGSNLVSGLLGVSNQQPVSYALPTYGPAPQPVAMPIPTAAGSVPMAALSMTRWATRFPSLWQAIQKFKAQRINMTPEKLYSALRKFGPATLSTMIGAAAVADLIAYKTTTKRRRMNPANTRALRRSMRRLKSFNSLSHRVSMQLGRAGGARRRRGPCRTCRKNPCSC